MNYYKNEKNYSNYILPKLETEIKHLEYLLHLPQSTIADEYGTEEDFAADSPGRKESSAHMLYQNYIYFYEAEEDKDFPVVARNLYYPLSAIDPLVSNQFVSVKRSNTTLAEMVVDCFSKVDPDLASFSKKTLFAKNPTIELRSRNRMLLLLSRITSTLLYSLSQSKCF